jgi:hypothetical protein
MPRFGHGTATPPDGWKPGVSGPAQRRPLRENPAERPIRPAYHIYDIANIAVFRGGGPGCARRSRPWSLPSSYVHRAAACGLAAFACVRTDPPAWAQRAPAGALQRSADFIAAEIANWGKVARDTGIAPG